MTQTGTGEIPRKVLEIPEEEKKLDIDIERDGAKLKFYAEQAVELIDDYEPQEIEITINRMNEIYEKILNTISRSLELKIERGVSNRQVRQLKQGAKENLIPSLEEKNKLSAMWKDKQQMEAQQKEREALKEEMNRKQIEQARLTEVQQQQSEYEESARKQRYQLEKDMWEEKLQAELEVIEKKMELERRSQLTHAKLPKLQLTPFNGTPLDWVNLRICFLHKFTVWKSQMR